jgi:formamidopyrimidine-DNA glycosylase
MPELPEVETVVRSLRQNVRGARIESVDLRFRSVFKNADSADFLAAQGTRIRDITRAGKYILFHLDRGDEKFQLMLHLGMTGRVMVVDPATAYERHTHAVLSLSSRRELRYVDPRRFGQIRIAPANGASVASTLGIASGAEPLEITDEAFVDLFFGRKGPIKNALLNQRLLRGMGNIYADESLFRAGIHPKARLVSRPRLKRLRRAIQQVLKEAIAAGGSSISDYVDSDGQPGWFQVRHRVYGREGERCTVCKARIRRVVLAGRSAHYCPKCQTR